MPQPVNSNVATINLSPNGNLVSVIASVQSSGTESVTITDGNGNTAFSASGASSSGGTFTVIGSGTFNTVPDPNSNGTYTVTLTSGCAYLMEENTISLNGGYFLQQYTFVTNDGGWPAGDNDFNDLCVQIICFGYQG